MCAQDPWALSLDTSTRRRLSFRRLTDILGGLWLQFGHFPKTGVPFVCPNKHRIPLKVPPKRVPLDFRTPPRFAEDLFTRVRPLNQKSRDAFFLKCGSAWNRVRPRSLLELLRGFPKFGGTSLGVLMFRESYYLGVLFSLSPKKIPKTLN